MPRLFVAIDFPEEIRQRLSILCCGLPGARWTDPEHLHLTLRFIGDVDAQAFRDIREILVSVRSPSFALHLQGVGFFPPRGNPRVLWAGINPCEPLIRLRNRIESLLVGSGLEPEGRKFSPHVTLARLKNTPGTRIGAFLAHNGLFMTEEFQINNFFLYSSILNSKGAKHFIEQDYPLSGG